MTALHPDIIKSQIAQLRLQYGELESDEESWLLTLESQTDLNELADKLIDRERECAALAGGIVEREIALAERRKRFEQQGLRIRGVLLALMQAANLPRLERPEATISISKGRDRVEIEDEAAVPDAFCNIKRTPNKTLIKELLTGTGVKPNWARMSKSEPSLSMRTK